MKLTKQKLEQLILQEMEYYRPPQFDPRAKKNYPEYSGKLSKLYKTDPEQATSLADSLDEPIDVESPDFGEDKNMKARGNLKYHNQFHKYDYINLPERQDTDTGLVEIQFYPMMSLWRVDYYEKTYTGSFMFIDAKEFSNHQEAKQYYENVKNKNIVP
jgi:hypothetical protein